MPLYIMLSDVCFWSLTFILSAGKDRNAVVTEARIAEMFEREAEDWGLKNGLIISVMI